MTRDCECYQEECCEGDKPHCGKTNYGCWFKDFTAEELADMKAMALKTKQPDHDLNWFLIPGDPGGVWRDQCGNEPIVYDAYEVDRKEMDEDDRVAYRDPPFPKNWDKLSEAEKRAYSDEVKSARKKYEDDHPDLAFIGKMHPGRVLRLIRMAERNLPK